MYNDAHTIANILRMTRNSGLVVGVKILDQATSPKDPLVITHVDLSYHGWNTDKYGDPKGRPLSRIIYCTQCIRIWVRRESTIPDTPNIFDAPKYDKRWLWVSRCQENSGHKLARFRILDV